MRNWRKQREAPPSVQLRSGERHPFGVLREYVPLGRGEARLYPDDLCLRNVIIQEKIQRQLQSGRQLPQ